MRIFVTGATGVLGQPTVRLLVARGHQVTALVRDESRSQLVLDMGARSVQGDLFDPARIRAQVAEADSVLHLATAIPKGNAANAWAMNDRIRREGTQNLLDAARERTLHSLVIQSITFLVSDTHGEWKDEDAPVPRKLPPMLRSAADMERAALAAYRMDDTRVVILRGARFYGPTASSTRSLLDAVKHRRMPIIGSGAQYWHWIYVDDMARAVALAAEHPAPGEIFNVADDWPFHAADGLNYIAAQLHAPPPFRLTPALARVMLGSIRAYTQSERYRTDKIRRMLGWAPNYPTYREGFAEIFRQMGLRV